MELKQRQNTNVEAPLAVQPDSVPASASDNDEFDADAFAERVLEQKQLFLAEKNGGAYISFVNNKGHRETLHIDQSDLSSYLIDRYYAENRKSIVKSKFSAVVQRFKAQAMRGRTVLPIHSRIAMRADSFFYNLGTETGDIVRVDAKGWKIINSSELPDNIHFELSPTHVPQTVPVKTDNSVDTLLRPYIHLDADDYHLFVITVLSLFLELIAKPVIMLEGMGGSGKTFISKIVQALVDPVAHDAATLPRNSRDVQSVLGSQYLCTFDNVTTVTESVGAVICNAVTGGAVTVRRLYTNAAVHAESFRNAVVINGIDIGGLRPDFLSRVVAFELKSFKTGKGGRLLETNLWKNFEERRGELMGAIFNALSAAYAAEPCASVPPDIRMTDFCDWGSRLSHSLYGREALFLNLYTANRAAVNAKMVEGDTLCAAFLAYAAIPEHRDRETETSGELYGKFKKYAAQKAGINVNQRTFPQDASAFSKRLLIMTPILEAHGVAVENRRSNKKRYKTIRLLGNG